MPRARISESSPESQLFLVARTLTDIVNEAKPSAKKALPVLQDLCVPQYSIPLRHSTVDVFSPVLKLSRCGDGDHRVPMLAVAVLASLKRARPPTQDELKKVIQMAQLPDTAPLLLRTAGLLALLECTSAANETAVPQALLNSLDSAVKSLTSVTKEKKKIMQSKSKKEQEQREKTLFHVVCLACYCKWFPTTPDNSKVFILTAAHHSKKKREADVVRGALQMLRRYVREVPAVDLTPLVKYLPTTQAHIHASMLPTKDKKKDKKSKDTDEPQIFPTHDTFTTHALSTLCLEILQKEERQKRSTATTSSDGSSKFGLSLKQLIHHHSAYVFSETVLGLFSRGLTSILLEPDVVYAGSKDTILDYVAFRTQNFLKSTSHLEVHAGLRLCKSLCKEATTLCLMSQSATGGGLGCEGIQKMSDTILLIEQSIQSVQSNFHFCPHVTTQAAAVQIWIGAFYLCIPQQVGDGTVIPADEFQEWGCNQTRLFQQSVTSILHLIKNNQHWSHVHTAMLIENWQDCITKVPGELKGILLPMLIDFLHQLCTMACLSRDVIDGSTLYNTFREILLRIDITGPPQSGDGLANDTDIDAVQYSRTNGDAQNYTLQLVTKVSAALMESNTDTIAVGDSNQKKNWIRKLLACVSFLGEFGNVMSAQYPTSSTPTTPTVNSKLSLILNTISHIGSCCVQSEVTHGCCVALLTIAARSQQHVRVAVYHTATLLNQIQTANTESTDFTAGIHVSDNIVQIIYNLLDMGSKVAQLPPSPNDATLLSFLDKHEAIKGMVLQYCSLFNEKKFKLFGKATRPLLERAYSIKHPCSNPK